MKFTKEVADIFYKARIFLSHNSTEPSSLKYGWMALPTDVKISSPIIIEERVGLYGGMYRGSSGAPGSHGLCNIGAFSYSASPLPEAVKIGRYCSISTGLIFLDSHHHTHLITTSAITFRPHNNLWRDIYDESGCIMDQSWDIYGSKKFPEIGNDVWIGRDVTLSMGIKIGNGSIVAANSTVTKDVPPYSIVGGNPAMVLRTRFPNDISHRLHNTEWWNLDPKLVLRASMLPVDKALADFESASADQNFFDAKSIKITQADVTIG